MRLHEHFTVSCPAGTLSSAPVERALTVQPGRLLLAQVIISQGHAGLTGFYLALAHQRTAPRTPGAWVVGDGAWHSYELADEGDSGAWSIFLYNTDLVDHLWQIRMSLQITRPVKAPPAPRELLPYGDIYEAADRLMGR